MKENDWTQRICDKLKKDLVGNLQVETLRKLPYENTISGYGGANWNPQYTDPSLFETDLVVYETVGEIIKPRVIVEAKIKKVTTHDAITYSYKAQRHKEITPYLRYGIMLGDRGDFSLPVRLFKHGANFDFMFSFEEEKPTDKEWNAFLEMIESEVGYSRQIENMLSESGKKDRKYYFMLQKQLVTQEVE